MDFLLRDERIPESLTLEEKKDWVRKEFNFAKYGFSSIDAEKFRLGKSWKESISFSVPICPICKKCFLNFEEQIICYVDDQVSDLR